MFGYDRVIGACMLAVATISMVYYLVWVIGQPFMDEDSFLQPFFPDPLLAIVVPTVILVFLATLTGVFIVMALVRDCYRVERDKVE